MRLTCNKQTALAITRHIRSTGMSGKGMHRTNILGPDLSPRKRWTKNLADLSAFGLEEAVSAESSLHIAVADSSARPRSAYVHATTYSGNQVLPPKSFIEVVPGLAISSPELIFVEMAETLELPELVMLGHELCGTFSRNCKDPLNGDVSLHLKPLTTKKKILEFARTTRYARGSANAIRALDYVADNAWSPTESVIATITRLPFAEFGYEFDDCRLNERVYAPDSLKAAAATGNRVPDILIDGTRVGINYDGAVHLDLNSIVEAALELGRNPGQELSAVELDHVVRAVRAKAVDDIRRNRELAAAGYIVFPVVKEDLYEEGGLDRVMMQVIEALERYEGRDMSEHRRLMSSDFARAKRQELVWSLLAGNHPSTVSHREQALPHLYGERKVNEVMVGI